MQVGEDGVHDAEPGNRMIRQNCKRSPAVNLSIAGIDSVWWLATMRDKEERGDDKGCLFGEQQRCRASLGVELAVIEILMVTPVVVRLLGCDWTSRTCTLPVYTQPLAFPDLEPTAAAALIEPLLPLLGRLDTHDIKYATSLRTHPRFWNASRSTATLDDYGVGLWHFGGRLLPASLDTIEDDGIAFDVAVHPSLAVAGNPDNAVLPAWRETERLFIPMLVWDDYASWDQILRARDKTWNAGGEVEEEVEARKRGERHAQWCCWWWWCCFWDAPAPAPGGGGAVSGHDRLHNDIGVGIIYVGAGAVNVVGAARTLQVRVTGGDVGAGGGAMIRTTRIRIRRRLSFSNEAEPSMSVRVHEGNPKISDSIQHENQKTTHSSLLSEDETRRCISASAQCCGVKEQKLAGIRSRKMQVSFFHEYECGSAEECRHERWSQDERI
ncbi:hypothetical protein B0H19DRAFT_1238223 [Mycena capillaripes]|nr:hypothetical protein B0H19DRAFT_1238223 [Mycena capillaripes]